MSVYLIDNDSFFGYRVRRVIGGVPHQHYFSLLGNGKRLKGKERAEVEFSAEKLDLKLEKQQTKARRSRERESIPSNRAGDPLGVKGISVRSKRTVRGEKSYSYTVFQVNCMSKIEGKPICTTFSIDAHGWEGAWLQAVRFYAKHKGLRQYGHLVKRIPSQQKAKRILKQKTRKAG
ncbi:MAG: hypothetical protein KUG76_03440 [Gammaproteobacteria bacterium]|nr:hypothetical protein [Gammaproteobacteria bacterium]